MGFICGKEVTSLCFFTAQWRLLSRPRDTGWGVLVSSLFFKCSSFIASLFVRVKMVLDQRAKMINDSADAQKTLQTANIHQYFQSLLMN